MTTPEPGVPDAAKVAPKYPWLRTLLPHLITAIVAITISVAVQAAIVPAPQASPPTPVRAPATATPLPTRAPTSIPTRAPALDEGIARQELDDLRAENSRMYTMIYLYRAIFQITDAETLLRSNNRLQVDHTLIDVDESLSLAYDRADHAAQDPIYQLRLDINNIRDDLFLRPEGMDKRLGLLRQTILALVDERR